MTVATANRHVLHMSEQLNQVELNFNNTIIHSRLQQFDKKVKDSGLSIKLGYKGEEDYYFEDRKLSIGPGRYLIVNRHTKFECYLNAQKPVEAFCLYLSKSIILETAHTLQSSHRDLLENFWDPTNQEPRFLEKVYRTDENELGRYLEQIRPALERNQLLDLNAFFHTLAEKLILSQGVINQQIENISSSRRSTREELYRRLCIARQYILDNYYKDIQLEELAKEAMLSKFHLLRSYREAFGVTPYRQVLNLRLKRSLQLLQEGHTLEDIALSLGFSDRRSFTKAFKKVFGCAPSVKRAAFVKQNNVRVIQNQEAHLHQRVCW